MESAFYWVVGITMTVFFGFFAAWTYDEYDNDLSHTTLFWLSVGATVAGGLVLLIAAIATGVAAGRGDSNDGGTVRDTDCSRP